MTSQAEKQERQTIIIVEDDHANATMLEMLLSMGTGHISFSYQSAVDLIKNIDEVKRSRPALFLVDYFLPAVNGLALCRFLRQTKEFLGIPVVLVSGSNDHTLLEEAQQMGIKLLHKPYDVDALFSVVRKFTSQAA